MRERLLRRSFRGDPKVVRASSIRSAFHTTVVARLISVTVKRAKCALTLCVEARRRRRVVESFGRARRREPVFGLTGKRLRDTPFDLRSVQARGAHARAGAVRIA
jgi:hypothetical protein